MTPEQRAILSKYVAKQASPTNSFQLEDFCFSQQLNFITDSSQFVTAVTSRRAGKTTACALELLWTAQKYPKSVSLYVTLARTNAKRIVWPLLLDLNQELKLGGNPNLSDLSISFKNGSIIHVSGAATQGEIERFRGLALTLVYIDECQSFPLYLNKLIDDVLVPACFDNKGKVKLIGTPGPVPIGYFYDATHNNKWSHHTWSIFQNPWILKKRGEEPHAILQQEMERRGVTETDPTIQREMFGKWVLDTANLVLSYSAERNHYDELPPEKLDYIMGIDLGFHDADAICTLGHGSFGPDTYLIDEKITTKQGLTDLFQQVETLRSRYNPYKIVIDTGGLGLKIAEEMRRRWRVPVHAAEKKRKFENLEILNDSLRTSRFRAQSTSRFAHDSMLLEWDMDKLQPDKKVISDRFHSDIIDAVLYAFRESPAYSWKPTPTIPKYGSLEWATAEAKRMEETAEEHFKEQALIEEYQRQEGTEVEWL